MHVLILNHHPLQTRFIQKGLRYQNIGADTCHPDNLEKVWYGQYDAMVVPIQSWNHPSFTELNKKIRKIGNAPTLISTKTLPPKNIQTEINKTAHIKFVGTHVPFVEFIKTLKSHINVHHNPSTINHILQIGELTLNIETHEAERECHPLNLRNKEFGLLESLMRNPGKPLTRTYLLENVWDRNTSILSNTVDVHVNRLRQKVDDGFKYDMIKTVHCVGYRLISEPEIDQLRVIK